MYSHVLKRRDEDVAEADDLLGAKRKGGIRVRTPIQQAHQHGRLLWSEGAAGKARKQEIRTFS